MKKQRFSDSQIIQILKQAEGGVPVGQLCREHGMSSASFYKLVPAKAGMAQQIWRDGCVDDV